jgi:DNA-binding beta-propeller fold protein YncE
MKKPVHGSTTLFAFLALSCTLFRCHAADVQHFEYVFQDHSLYVYDVDNGFSLIKTVSIPTDGNPRGAVASAATGMLYVSYGPDTSAGGGKMFKYDLLKDVIVWNQTYPFGIDSMSISPDGNTIYMPDGEIATDGIWEIIDASTGKVTGSIDSQGVGPHNTLLNASGTHVYMGPRGSNYLVKADTATGRVLQQIGPFTPLYNKVGVRPFTVNGSETLSFVTVTGRLGFQVGDIATGRVLYDVPIQGFSWDGSGKVTAPSHGISISPDEKELWVIDAPNSYVHVYDITGLPGRAPIQVADIALEGQTSGEEQGCAYDCEKEGWLHHSRDGRYVFVGDSGDVIDTATRRTVAMLPAMADTRIFIEVDFQNGVPVWAMANRNSEGTVPALSGGISLVQSNAVEASSVSSISAAFPSANTAGNLIVAFVRMSTATQSVSVSDTAGNVYTDSVSQAQTVDGHQIHIFYAKGIGGGSNTVTATFSGANNHPWLAVYEYSGLSTTNPLDQTASAEGNSTTPSSGATAVTTSGNELIFAGAGLVANFTGTAGAGGGFAVQQQDNGTSRAINEVASVSSIGSFSATFNVNPTTNWSAVIATFRASPSGVRITTVSPPSGVPNTAYITTLAASGGTAPYSWSIMAGTLPAGLSLAATSGVISGTPTASGTTNFTVMVTDSSSQTATQTLSILITTTLNLAVVQSAQNGTSGAAGNTGVVALPGTAPGDLLVIAVHTRDGVVSTVTDTEANAFVRAVSQTASNQNLEIWYATNIGGGGDTITVQAAATTSFVWVEVTEYSGIANAGPLDQVASASGIGPSASSGNTAVTAQPNELVVGVVAWYACGPNTLATAGSGFASRQTAICTSETITEDKFVTSAGTYNGASTGPNFNNSTWIALVATFKAGG